MRLPIPIIGPSFETRSPPLSAQVTKNLYPAITPEGKNIVSLHAFPGYKVFSTLSGSGRGMTKRDGVLFAVSGLSFYEVDSSGVSDEKGTIAGTSICDFASNETQIFIANGADPYLYGDTLQQITDDDVHEPTTVTWINGYFVMDSQENKGEFVTTKIDTTLTAADIVDSLDFATAEAHPDDILKAINYNQYVYFFGSESTEPWWNSGTGTPPFDRVQGAVLPFGIAGQYAAYADDEAIFVLDNERIPRKIVGLQHVPIGNEALGREFSTYSDVSDCQVYSYLLDHQKFVQYNFPTANRSWVYHERSNSWVQKSYGVDDARDRGMSYCFCYGKHLVQDHENGIIYEMDFDTFTDNGAVIQRRRRSANVHGGIYQQNGKGIEYARVQFDMETGVGINTGQGSDPMLMVRYSDDGGRTWSAEIQLALGVGGDYERRAELYNSGTAFNRVFELTYSEPTRCSIYEANGDIAFGV